MAEYVVLLREGGSVTLEGARLNVATREGSSAPVISPTASGGGYIAIMPADAIKAVYRKDAEKVAPPRPLAV